eukprot:104419-Rhodomonas_salina.2
MSGTELAYGATTSPFGAEEPRLRRVAGRTRREYCDSVWCACVSSTDIAHGTISLRAHYAMSDTESAYSALRTTYLVPVAGDE